jgi:hypothetical protein
VETPPAWLMGRFELLRTRAAEMGMPAGSIAKGIDVLGHVRDRELAVLVDLLLEALLLEAAEERLGDGVVPAVALAAMLGSRSFDRQKRRQASLPNCVP